MTKQQPRSDAAIKADIIARIKGDILRVHLYRVAQAAGVEVMA